MTTPELRDQVVSLRLTAAERERLARLLGQPDNLSAEIRTALFAHLAEQPTCAATRPGTFTATWLPTCLLPADHGGLPHWWRHQPSGYTETWELDDTIAVRITMLSPGTFTLGGDA